MRLTHSNRCSLPDSILGSPRPPRELRKLTCHMNPLRIRRVLKKTISVSQTDRKADRKTVLEIFSTRQIPILPGKKHAQSPPSPKKSTLEIKTLPALQRSIRAQYWYSTVQCDNFSVLPLLVLRHFSPSCPEATPIDQGADQINHLAEMF